MKNLLRVMPWLAEPLDVLMCFGTSFSLRKCE
jgi:hypothetical protein